MGLAARTYAGHFTIADWKHWKDQWELIDGVPYGMSPAPSQKHQEITARLVQLLDARLESCPGFKAMMQVTWIVNSDTVVQPDIAVVSGEYRGSFIQKPPAMVAEVLSPNTHKKDYTEKFELYRQLKVKYYAIVNPESFETEIFAAENGFYRLLPGRGACNFDIGNCSFELDLEEIWK